jgi:hypothetical protein
MTSVIEQRFLFSEPRKTIRYRDYDKLVDDISALVEQEKPESFFRITLCLAGRFNSLVVAGFTAFSRLDGKDKCHIHRGLYSAMNFGVCHTDEFETLEDVPVELLGVELICGDVNKLLENIHNGDDSYSFMKYTSGINKRAMPPNEFDLWLKENLVCSNFKNATWHQAQEDAHELSLPPLIRNVVNSFDTYS